MITDLRLPKSRRFLSADRLIATLRQRLQSVEDPRRESQVSFSMVDCLMAAFATFSLKDPSLLAIDGTGYFSSANISCPSCLEKTDRAGNTKYAHQMVAAVLVHPNRKEVIPLAIEPIVKQDGESKNDCERNATRRLLLRIKKQHPKLKLPAEPSGLSGCHSTRATPTCWSTTSITPSSIAKAA